MNPYRKIDLSAWKRREHFAVFRNCIEPAFCTTFELNVTRLQRYAKDKNYSFTFSLIYTVAKCAGGIEEFRYRFLDGNVVLFDAVDTAFTYFDAKTELFKVVNVPMAPTMEEYVCNAAKTAATQKEYFTGPLGNDIFQFSPLPWLAYTHISHTNSGNRDNATPLFDWGKYQTRNGNLYLPFTVQVHHSFVDGFHVAKLADTLQNDLNSF